jgi:hypothetical protein
MQFNMGILGRKLPFHRLLFPVPFIPPSLNFSVQFFQRVYPPVMAVACHGA